MELAIISRDAAQAQGKVRYFTGTACKHGHLAERFVSSGGCVRCVNRQRNVALRAPNVAMPPSGYVFRSAPTPQLLSAVHAKVLKLLPELEAAARAELAERMPLKLDQLAPTDKANGATLESFIEAGWSCEQLVSSGYAYIMAGMRALAVDSAGQL